MQLARPTCALRQATALEQKHCPALPWHLQDNAKRIAAKEKEARREAAACQRAATLARRQKEQQNKEQQRERHRAKVLARNTCDVLNSNGSKDGTECNLAHTREGTIAALQTDLQRVKSGTLLEMAIAMLINEAQPGLQKCLETLSKLVYNIARTKDPKHRRIRKGNPTLQKHVFSMKHAVGFLCLVGFEDDPLCQFMELKVEDPAIISAAAVILESAMAQRHRADPAAEAVI